MEGYTIEIWKPITGYEYYYEISNLGRVKSLQRKGLRNGKPYLKKEKILKPIQMGNYLGVQLAVNKTHEKHYIHRLVAEHFLEKPFSTKELIVNHKNGEKHNNQDNNLEWVTYKENIQHAYENRLNPNFGENSHYAKYSDETVKKVRDLFATGKYLQSELAEMFGISRMQIHRIVKNKNRKHLEVSK
jgi:hypothetical protein